MFLIGTYQLEFNSQVLLESVKQQAILIPLVALVLIRILQFSSKGLGNSCLKVTSLGDIFILCKPEKHVEGFVWCFSCLWWLFGKTVNLQF